MARTKEDMRYDILRILMEDLDLDIGGEHGFSFHSLNDDGSKSRKRFVVTRTD